jgi:S-DNA-T family DNA segregation ATPase FtsK/SpoIIIE
VDVGLELRFALGGAVRDDAFDFGIGDERALGTLEFRRAGREVKHVALADEEVERLVEHCASQADPNYEEDVQATIESGASDDAEDDVSDADEEMIIKCIDVVRQEQKCSTSLLQRRLRLGYTRAARMVDILEQRGVVGPGDGAKAREVFVK